ncbi:MAG: hypothetical protein WD035_12235 [Balneolaceae bacterium]
MNPKNQKELREKFWVAGVPTIVFPDENGKEVKGTRGANAFL